MEYFNNLSDLELPVSISWALGACMEARGKQELWNKTKPEILKSLRELAIIQSVESSNRIEGVTVDHDRLKPLVLGNAKPTDRPEEEIFGYKQALKWIHVNYKKIVLTPAVIQKLHLLCQQGFVGDAGKWKIKDNEIIEIDNLGNKHIRFKAMSASETPNEIKKLCNLYTREIVDKKNPDLLVIANFIFDFLCIHPFRDGNGRVSRLLTTLLLYQNSYEISRYISLERIIEETKEDYYRVLNDCSKSWHQYKHDIVPWIYYFLSVIRQAFKELESRVELSDNKVPKGELIKQIILNQGTEFTLADIQKLCPTVSEQMIRKILTQLKEEKKVLLFGKGRGAKWTLI